MTPLVEQIMSSHRVAGEIRPGRLATVRVDRIYIQDGNAPTVARLFQEFGFDRILYPERVGVFFDHSVLSPTAAISTRLREAEQFARAHGLHVLRGGEGISHIVAAEAGWFEPGSLIVGTDSHTCTGGVTQSLALGLGASDVVGAMVTGWVWVRVPETVWVRTVGRPGPHTTAKDVMLFLLSRHAHDTFLYRSMQWCGDWVESLSPDAAATLANMAVECGAKCVFLPPGPGRTEGLQPIRPPADAGPVVDLDITGLPPYVARPGLPQDAVELDLCAGQPLQYVFVGTCTNGRLEDIAAVAAVVEGRRLHDSVHLVVTPGSRQIYLDCLRLGYLETLVRAGAVVSPPGCGACVGTQGTIPADGDHVLTTMNRNFKGRMGNPNAKIWLASPSVAAHAALLGRIPRTSELE